MIDNSSDDVSIAKQCKLLEINRSSLYYKNKETKEEKLKLLKNVDKIYTSYPFYGSRRIKQVLKQEYQQLANRKTIQKAMRELGIAAITPRRNLSRALHENKKYPYLLRGLKVNHSDHVWSSDITYIPTVNGYMYLVAIVDWFSRCILSWELSNTLDTDFCINCLEEALSGKAKPFIFNTDQGCQFTSESFTSVLLSRNIQISMDGRGRALDNIFIERFWRSLKYEEVYLREYKDGKEARDGLSNYIRFYNTKRPHQSLGYKTPQELYNLHKVN